MALSKAHSIAELLSANALVPYRVSSLFHELTTEVPLGSELMVREATKGDVSRAVRPIEGQRLEMMKFEMMGLAAALAGLMRSSASERCSSEEP